MAFNPKASESQKYQALVVATLDYLIDHYTGEFIYDGFDPVKEHYKSQKVQAEKYGERGQLQKLKEQLEKSIERVQSNLDSDFPGYIMRTTGYELDILKNLTDFGDEVLLRGEIKDEMESRKLRSLLTHYAKANPGSEKQMQLDNILNNFYIKAAAQQKRNGTSQIVKTEEKDGLMTETIEISFGPKPKHLKRRKIISADRERRLYISEWMNSEGTQANTTVSISFKTAGGGIYTVEGIQPAINAFWGNNNTVVIETSEDYNILEQHRIIQSFEDVVNVEYILTSQDGSTV